MKKTICIILALVIFLMPNVYAFDSTLFAMRNKIFYQSKNIKELLTKTNDPILVSSMFDSCIVALTQLDAYFIMLGIFNTIKRKDINKVSTNYLIRWLDTIQKTNGLNIKSLSATPKTIEVKTKVYVERLKAEFRKLNTQIDNEKEKISALNRTIR